MRGIATIDRQPEAEVVAVWVTSRQGQDAAHANAVVIDFAADPNAVEKVRSLTRCCAVLVTDGSTLHGLPVEGAPLESADLDALLVEVAERQEAVRDAIRDYKRRTRSSALIEPQFAEAPTASDFVHKDDSASARAFAMANFLQRAWTSWLRTDEERRRRTVQPKTGLTPWVMPEEMNEPTVSDFPARFASRLNEQPLV